MLPAPKGTLVRFSLATAPQYMAAQMEHTFPWLVPGTLGVVADDATLPSPAGSRQLFVRYFVKPEVLALTYAECLFILPSPE